MQDVVPFGQIFYCTARCKQGRDTITKKILLLGKRLNAKRDELGDSRPLGHRKHYTKISLERLLHRILARITNAPARLGCAEPPWTFAIGFARRDPAAPPVQGMTSHPTGDRRDAIGRIHRPPDRPLRFKASGTPARRTCEAIRRVRVQFPWRAIAEGRPGPICAGSCCGSSASSAGEGGRCC